MTGAHREDWVFVNLQYNHDHEGLSITKGLPTLTKEYYTKTD